jgi:hypothetical protein
MTLFIDINHFRILSPQSLLAFDYKIWNLTIDSTPPTLPIGLPKMKSIEQPSLQNIHRDSFDKIIQAIIDMTKLSSRNFTTREAVERVNADTRPCLEGEKPWKVI